MDKKKYSGALSIDSGMEDSRRYDSELQSKLKEAEDWMQSSRQKDSKKGWGLIRTKKDDGYGNQEKFNHLVAYMGDARDKLYDELVFKEDSIRKIDIKIHKMRKDLESRKSLLEELVVKRDEAREAYGEIDEIKNKIGRQDQDYILIQEQHHRCKKEKESAENAATSNAWQYKTIMQNLKIMTISAEQRRLSYEDDKIIVKCVEDAMKNINAFYHQIIKVM